MSPITDGSGKPIQSEKAKEEQKAEKAEAAEQRGERSLQISRLRTGQLLLAFIDAANKRIGAVGFMRQLEEQKQQQGIVGKVPQLELMYDEVMRLEAQVVGLVEEINVRFVDRDEQMAVAEGVELYTNKEFFGRSQGEDGQEQQEEATVKDMSEAAPAAKTEQA